MCLAAVEARQLRQCLRTAFIALAQHRQCDQHLVGMQARVMPLQVRNLGMLDRRNHLLRQQFHRVVDMRQMFRGIDEQRRRAAQQIARMGGDNSSVFQLNRRCRSVLPVAACLSRHRGTTIIGCDTQLAHEKSYLVDFLFGVVSVGKGVQCSIVVAVVLHIVHIRPVAVARSRQENTK